MSSNNGKPEVVASASTSATATANADADADMDIDWTTVFPAARIKAILQKEPSIGRLPKESVEMVGASSALFLKYLFKAAQDAAVQAANGTASTGASATGTDTDTTDQYEKASNRPIVITAADVRRAVESKESWHLFAAALEDEEELFAPTSTAAGGKRKRKPAPKKPPKEEVGKSLDPSLDEALQIAALESTTATTNGKEIVIDDEDYDS
jgi:hypothetical protein